MSSKLEKQLNGTLHANRVTLNNTAVVEVDIFHLTLVIEENARFEGSSRREENIIDLTSSTPANRRQPQANTALLDKKGNATSAAE